jgi:NADPH:quinone reductase-like Zn-dependent oxidoreductase
MKIMVWTKYGPPDVLELKKGEKPTPKEDEVLIRGYAATVTSGDGRVRSFTPATSTANWVSTTRHKWLLAQKIWRFSPKTNSQSA